MEDAVRVQVQEAGGHPVSEGEVSFEWRSRDGGAFRQRSAQSKALGDGLYAVMPYGDGGAAHSTQWLFAHRDGEASAFVRVSGGSEVEGQLVLRFAPKAWLDVHALGGAAMAEAGTVASLGELGFSGVSAQGAWPRLELRTIDSPAEVQLEMTLEEVLAWPEDDTYRFEALAPGRYELTLHWMKHIQLSAGGSSGEASQVFLRQNLELSEGANQFSIDLPPVARLTIESAGTELRAGTLVPLPLALDNEPFLTFGSDPQKSQAGRLEWPAVAHGRYLLKADGENRLIDVPVPRSTLNALPLTGDVVFKNLDAGGALVRAGFREGDRLLELDGEPVNPTHVWMFARTRLYEQSSVICTVKRPEGRLELILDTATFGEAGAGGFLDIESLGG